MCFNAQVPMSIWHAQSLIILFHTFLQYQQCHMCGGFYGSNHSQPLCSTCHLFLTSSLNMDEEEEFYSKSKKVGDLYYHCHVHHTDWKINWDLDCIMQQAH